jgi:hypothetical protein
VGKYSGNLVRSFAHAEETQNFEPDKAHGITDFRDRYDTVNMVPADMGSEYAGTDIPVDVVIGGGSVLGTPRRSHEGLAGRRMVYTDDQHRESLADRHAEDGQRGYVSATYKLPELQDARSAYWDEWRSDETWGEHQNNTGAVALLRGNKTAIPQNNPEGVRAGMIRQGGFSAERRLGRRRYIYQAQQLIDRATYQDANVPAPANPSALSGGSVFDSWQPAGAFTRVKRPAMFRSPPDVDEAALSAPEPPGSDVIGGGF